MAFCTPTLLSTSLHHMITGQRDLAFINNPAPIRLKRSKEQKSRSVVTHISRRDALLHLTADAICGFTILATEPAEARMGRLEMKKKIMEKLEKIREKAGVLRPGMPKEKKPGPLAPPIPFPYPQEGGIGPLIESTVP